MYSPDCSEEFQSAAQSWLKSVGEPVTGIVSPKLIKIYAPHYLAAKRLWQNRRDLISSSPKARLSIWVGDREYAAYPFD